MGEAARIREKLTPLRREYELASERRSSNKNNAPNAEDDEAPHSEYTYIPRDFSNPSEETIQEATKLGVDLRDKRIQKVMVEVMKEKNQASSSDKDPKEILEICINKGVYVCKYVRVCKSLLTSIFVTITLIVRVEGAIELARRIIEGSTHKEMREMLMFRLKDNDPIASGLVKDINDDKIKDCLLDTMANDLLKLQDERAKREDSKNSTEYTASKEDVDTADSLRLLAAYGFDAKDKHKGRSNIGSLLGSDKFQIFVCVFCVIIAWAFINLSSSSLAVSVRRTLFQGYKGDPSKLKPRPILPHEEGYSGGFDGMDGFDEATMVKIAQMKRKDKHLSSIHQTDRDHPDVKTIDLDDEFKTSDERSHNDNDF